MNRDTPVEMAKADRKPVRSSLTSDSASAMSRKLGPYVNEMFVKIEYTMTGNCKAGILALITFAK
jgi:hypothetical protein